MLALAHVEALGHELARHDLKDHLLRLRIFYARFRAGTPVRVTEGDWTLEHVEGLLKLFDLPPFVGSYGTAPCACDQKLHRIAAAVAERWLVRCDVCGAMWIMRRS